MAENNQQDDDFGPITVADLEAMGFGTLAELKVQGWQHVGWRWADAYPDKLNANAFIGIIAALEGISWRQAKAAHRSEAQRFLRHVQRELGLI